jgi:thioredoxin-related protein
MKRLIIVLGLLSIFLVGCSSNQNRYKVIKEYKNGYDVLDTQTGKVCFKSNGVDAGDGIILSECYD